MVFIAFIINLLFIPSMTQAIFGGTAGLADSVSKVGGTIASVMMMAG
jgi:type IV secretion system protein VirB6